MSFEAATYIKSIFVLRTFDVFKHQQFPLAHNLPADLLPVLDFPTTAPR